MVKWFQNERYCLHSRFLRGVHVLFCALLSSSLSLSLMGRVVAARDSGMEGCGLEELGCEFRNEGCGLRLSFGGEESNQVSTCLPIRSMTVCMGSEI